MFPIRTKSRRGISVVITTLIILVSSVVLGTGVVFYGTSLFQTASQQQSIATQNTQIWVNSSSTSGIAWGAAAIRNNGDVLATVNTIQIRGVNIPFSNWYVDTDPIRVNQNFQAQFNYTRNDSNGNLRGSAGNGELGTVQGFNDPNNLCVRDTTNNPPTKIMIQLQKPATAFSPVCLKQQSTPVTLNPGDKMIVYYKVPLGLLSPVDSGSATTVNIFAGTVGGPISATVANP
ncbi:MAG: hypothetical protein ACHQW9_01615, partial [Nitrososphaerales archaeon]